MFLIYTLFCNSVDVFLLYCHFYSIFFVSVLIEVEDCAKIIEHHERFWKICHHDLARILKLVSTLEFSNPTKNTEVGQAVWGFFIASPEFFKSL